MTAEVDELLALYPPPIAATVRRLQRVMHMTVPDAVERVRAGWRLVGYDLPVGRRHVYFAWIWPQLEHVHLGWQVGTLLEDPQQLLGGAELKLKKVRYLTFAPHEALDTGPAIAFTREAARIARLSAGEQQAMRHMRSLVSSR
jgi:hypothetical protein